MRDGTFAAGRHPAVEGATIASVKIEHKVAYWDGASPHDLEGRLNELGEEGWSAVAAAASGDSGFLVVMTKTTRRNSEIPVVQLAFFHRVRQIARWLVEQGSQALTRSAQSGTTPVLSPAEEEATRTASQ